MHTTLENILISTHKNETILYVHQHPECVPELIDLALGQKEPFSWRAMWLLWSVADLSLPAVEANLDRFIERLTDFPGGQKRECLHLLRLVKLDEEKSGVVFEACVQIWCKLDQAPGIRFNALRLLLQIAQSYPELEPEIRLLLEPYYLNTLSKGVLHSVLKRTAHIRK
jgi:hypothetical protein